MFQFFAFFENTVNGANVCIEAITKVNKYVYITLENYELLISKFTPVNIAKCIALSIFYAIIIN